MNRIIVMVLRNLLIVPYLWIRLCRYARHPERYTMEEHYKMLKNITKHANRGGRVTIKAYGQENIPKKDGFIFYPNHQGLYDCLAIIDSCNHPFAVVAKKEVANVPLLKQTFACVGAKMIDRQDYRQSLEVILQVAKEVQEGKNYVIFPEGTRCRMKNKMLPFKGGSFKAATKAKSPIVPVALIDSYKPFDTKTIEPVTVQVHYLEPLYYEEYKDLKTTEIAKIVQERIEQTIKEYE